MKNQKGNSGKKIFLVIVIILIIIFFINYFKCMRILSLSKFGPGGYEAFQKQCISFGFIK